MEGWADLGSLKVVRPGIEPTTAWSQVQRPAIMPPSYPDADVDGIHGRRFGSTAGYWIIPMHTSPRSPCHCIILNAAYLLHAHNLYPSTYGAVQMVRTCLLWWKPRCPVLQLHWVTSASWLHYTVAITNRLHLFSANKNGITACCGESISTTVPNLVTISQMSAELLRFSVFQDGGRPPSWILIQVKNGITARCGQSMSTIMPNLVTISQMSAELLRFSIFQNGGRLPSWIFQVRLISPSFHFGFFYLPI